MVLHSEVKSGKWLILFQNMMDSGMGTSAQTETFYGSGQVEVEGPEAHQGGGRQGGGGDGHQRPVFFFFEARKKSSPGGLKMKELKLLFGSFGYLADPR
jgi:hypothetical protein